MEHILTVSSFIIPLLLAITLHEAAHGFVASKLGDNTAKNMGRVTFDPLKHIDPFGTVVLPLMLMLSGSPILFGWAKPVPVNFNNLRNRKRDTILVAIAGPLTNIILAIISAFALYLEYFVTPEQAPWTFQNIYNSININVVLAVFNLLPILPLDGGRILNSLLPKKLSYKHAKSERYGMLIIALIFILPAFLADAGIAKINLSYYLIGVPADFLRDVVFFVARIGVTG